MGHEEENVLSLNIALEVKIKYFLYINVNLWVLLGYYHEFSFIASDGDAKSDS